jgi:iron(III) transport system substrate-binding protein
MKRILGCLSLLPWLALAPVAGAGELRVYSYLSPEYIGPVVEAFEAETGLPVSVEYMRAGTLLKRLKDEGDDPGADVIFTMEAKRLHALAEAGVLAPVRSDVLDRAIPARFRHPDGLWFGLSKWTRTVFYAKDRVDPAALTSYADLADPKWKGKICVRPSNKIYVQSLIASRIAHHGEAKAREWVRGIAANLARKPIDLDIEQIKGVASGVCDLAIANSYYYARLLPMPFDVLSNPGRREREAILKKAVPHHFDADPNGTHVNISGFAMTRATRNREAAQRFTEYMVRPAVQRLYADGSMDYPVINGLEAHKELRDLGSFTEDTLAIHELGAHYAAAERITKEAGWLWK